MVKLTMSKINFVNLIMNKFNMVNYLNEIFMAKPICINK